MVPVVSADLFPWRLLPVLRSADVGHFIEREFGNRAFGGFHVGRQTGGIHVNRPGFPETLLSQILEQTRRRDSRDFSVEREAGVPGMDDVQLLQLQYVKGGHCRSSQ